jgi:hypothetical protein
MMNKRNILILIFVSLLSVIPVLKAPAQTNTSLVSNTFDMTNFPQWTKDMRRWEIVAFGSIPFTIFAATFFYDTYQWYDNSQFSFSNEDLRYAPWPLKTAGAVEMPSRDREMIFLTAACASIAIAFADLIIVQVKRQRERRRIENMPPGTAIIIRQPYQKADSKSEDEAAPGNDPSIAPQAIDFSLR